MREIRLPAYPLYTFDPMMSLWSMSDALYDKNIRMWTSREKPVYGYLVVDGKVYRFMGEGKEAVIPQTKVEMGLTSTKYTFENEEVVLEATFTTPFILSDLKLTSRPIAYTTVNVSSKDGKKHYTDVVFCFSENIVYRGSKRATEGWTEQLAGVNAGFLGRKKQEPMYNAGDRVETDWGHVCVAGQAKIAVCSRRIINKYLSGLPIRTGKAFRKNLIVEKSAVVDNNKQLSFYFCFGWEEGYSIDYFGVKSCGYWKKFYPDIRAALKDALSEYNEVMARCLEQDKKAESEIIPTMGLSYYTLLLASFRQAIAAHKLIEADGRPVFISKENSSNGCAATVDVTYPSVPLFLVENPAFVKAMLEPIFKFARLPLWRFDFAPHDAGVYPYVMGQVYAIHGKYRRNSYKGKRKAVYEYADGNEIYDYKYQMPVEESANMIILVAAYYNETGDKEYVLENADLLKKWADYLVKQGIELENQLSTDDFSGRLPKNVNLAAKSAVAIALWAKLTEKIGLGDGKEYMAKAKEMAKELKEKADRGDHYTIVLDKDGWSTKYNLVWDKIFGLDLFGKEVYDKEISYYKTKLNVYGLPLDGRHTYGKSDWMIWATVLDETDDALRIFSDTLCKMLAETTIRLPYPDLYETVAPSFAKNGCSPMYARTVQGGMWMPLYAQKVAQSNKNYLL